VGTPNEASFQVSVYDENYVEIARSDWLTVHTGKLPGCGESGICGGLGTFTARSARA
jgi:hypothetical protein